MCSEVYLFVFYTNFGSNVIAVKLYGFWRQIQHGSDFLGCFTLADEVGDLNLGGGQFHK
jgi:hypothetical protein